MKLQELWKFGQTYLKDKGIADYQADARFLLCHILQKDPSYLVLHGKEEADQEVYLALLEQRASGVPLQYILGETEFMSLKFFVDESVLIPRQETELLVEFAIGQMKNHKMPKILDLCTGSGCIAISLAKYLPGSDVYGADISMDALNVAVKNEELHGVNVKFYQEDVRSPFMQFWDLDAVVSNPPYIPTNVIPTLQREVKDREPISALDGGADGLNFYRSISPLAYSYLKPGGLIAFEIGWDQSVGVSEILHKNGFENVQTIKDYSGLDRIVWAMKNQTE